MKLIDTHIIKSSQTTTKSLIISINSWQNPTFRRLIALQKNCLALMSIMIVYIITEVAMGAQVKTLLLQTVGIPKVKECYLSKYRGKQLIIAIKACKFQV